MSTLAVNTITDANGGNNARLNGPACPDNSMGFRNRIINGDMRIDQRNAGASVTPADNAYTLDRWQARLSQASKYSVQQSSTAPTGFNNSLLVTSLSAYSVGASEFFQVRQIIEGFNVADLGFGSASAKTITLSFWVRSSLTGTFGGGLSNDAGNRSYVFSYSVNSADTWEYKTITIAGDTSGTWQTTTSGGFVVAWSLGSGSSVSGSAGSWGSTLYRGVTGGVSVVGTNGATFYITGVQLEVGSIATPFERRPYGTELSLCQRYYYLFVLGSNFPVVTSANYTSNESRGVVTFPTTMRGTPTVVSSSGTNHFAFFSNGASSQCNSLTADVLSANSAELKNNTSISVTTGYASWLRTSNASASLAFSAEL